MTLKLSLQWHLFSLSMRKMAVLLFHIIFRCWYWHRYLKYLSYSMLLASKRSALTPYSSLFSHIYKFFLEQKHRFFIFWWIRCLFSMNQTFFLFLRHRNWSFYIKSFHSASNQVHAISDQAKSKFVCNFIFQLCKFSMQLLSLIRLIPPKKSAEAVLYAEMSVFSIAFHVTLDQVYSSINID